jgi:hypothetical protein
MDKKKKCDITMMNELFHGMSPLLLSKILGRKHQFYFSLAKACIALEVLEIKPFPLKITLLFV